MLEKNRKEQNSNEKKSIKTMIEKCKNEQVSKWNQKVTKQILGVTKITKSRETPTIFKL